MTPNYRLNIQFETDTDHRDIFMSTSKPVTTVQLELLKGVIIRELSKMGYLDDQ